MTKMYFAKDGSYGDANEMVVVDTSLWIDEDWDAIESESDWHRPRLANTITTARQEGHRE